MNTNRRFLRPEDSEYEVKHMSPGIGTLDIYPSIWGHWAGGPPGNLEDVKWLDERLSKLLDEAPKLGAQSKASTSLPLR